MIAQSETEKKFDIYIPEFKCFHSDGRKSDCVVIGGLIYVMVDGDYVIKPEPRTIDLKAPKLVQITKAMIDGFEFNFEIK